MLTGLSSPGSTPAARRARLAALSDDALAEQLVSLALALRASDAQVIARAASLPLGEVIASPFALRAVALGVEAGARAVHLELRARPDWPDALGAPDEVRDPDHGTWERGVLKSGKYQGFLADEAFAIYDPSHVSKWGPHEMMHRAAGFFVRADATRWEHYLGARLNELVPVVLWYGPEQAMRLDEGAFDRAAAARAPAARASDARWLEEDEAALRARALRGCMLLREGLAHFERELAAIDEELATGARVRVSHPLLDASSDATAYVAGHFDRLRATARVTEAIVPSALACGDAGEYRDRVETLFDRLLFAPIELDLEQCASRASGRAVWDLVHRAAHLGAELAEELEPILDDARTTIARAWEGEMAGVARWREVIAEHLVDEEAALVLRDGAEPALDVLADGLASVVPCTHALLDDDAIARLAASDALWDRAPLAVRVERWLDRAELRELARFEHAIATARRDDGIERLCAPLDEVAIEEGTLVRSAAFDVLSFEHDVVAAHAAIAAGEHVEAIERAPSRWLVGAFFDSVSVVPCPAAIASVWDRLARGGASATELAAAIDRELGEVPEGFPPDGAAWLRELLEAGAIGWLGPAPRVPSRR